MGSNKATIDRARLRSLLTAPVLVLIAIAAASCGKADTVAAIAPPAVGESSSGPSTATPSHPKFLTVNDPHGSQLDGVNDAGTLVGVVYIEGNTRGLIEAGNKITEFDYPGTSDVTVVSGINDSGTTVGRYSDNLGGDRGFVRSADGRFTPIDDPNAGTAFYMGTKPMGINDSGIIVGTYVDNRDVAHGFVDTAGVFTTLNEPNASMTGDAGTFIDGINDAGSIIGYYVDSGGVLFGFVDTSGTYTSFAAPGAGKGRSWGTRSTALANDGIATGNEVGALGVSGWVRDGQTFYALNDPDAVSGLAAGTFPAGVNQDGREVVGTYFDAQRGMHSFIAYI